MQFNIFILFFLCNSNYFSFTVLCMNAVLATSCQIEYSKEMKTLTIQEQSECTFPDEILPYMSEISHLEINGIFVFSDSSPVLFSLASLSFGP